MALKDAIYTCEICFEGSHGLYSHFEFPYFLTKRNTKRGDGWGGGGVTLAPNYFVTNVQHV